MATYDSLDNLQPLKLADNIKKGAKYNKDDFEEWLTKKGVKWTMIEKTP